MDIFFKATSIIGFLFVATSSAGAHGLGNHKVIKMGEYGIHVKQLRCLLDGEGFRSKLNDPAVFDGPLVGWVRQYQISKKNQGVRNTGNAGPATLQALKANIKNWERCLNATAYKTIRDRKEITTKPRAPRKSAITPSETRLMAEQAVLDRLHFSPGEIDGRLGSNHKKARRQLEMNRNIDLAAMTNTMLEKLLIKTGGATLKKHTLTQHDVAGPFLSKPLPRQLEQQAKLEGLYYLTVEEKLGELFHMSPSLLRKLNPSKSFRTGETINIVAINQEQLTVDGTPSLRLLRSARILQLFDDGRLIATYPITLNPSRTPTTNQTIKGYNKPTNYTYKSKTHFRDNGKPKTFIIPPGPNNPVGTVWIPLSRPSFGVHGTPNPAKISKTSSAGCIRMTNWDVEELANVLGWGKTVQLHVRP